MCVSCVEAVRWETPVVLVQGETYISYACNIDIWYSCVCVCVCYVSRQCGGKHLLSGRRADRYIICM
jgi:hypothetical protein